MLSKRFTVAVVPAFTIVDTCVVVHPSASIFTPLSVKDHCVPSNAVVQSLCTVPFSAFIVSNFGENHTSISLSVQSVMVNVQTLYLVYTDLRLSIRISFSQGMSWKLGSGIFMLSSFISLVIEKIKSYFYVANLFVCVCYLYSKLHSIKVISRIDSTVKASCLIESVE